MKKYKLLTGIIGTSVAATSLLPLASCGCSKKFSITLDTTSSAGVKIQSSDLKINTESTITVELPTGYVIDNVHVVVDSKFVESPSIKGNVITIPAIAMTGYTVLLKVTTTGEKVISKAEWQEAIGKVCNITADRNYTMQVTQTYSGAGYSTKFEWDKYVTNYKVSGFTNQIDSVRINKTPGKEPHEGATTRTFNTNYEDLFWNITTKPYYPETYEKIKLISQSSFDNEGNFPVWFGLLYDQYDVFSYNPETKTYSLVVYDYDNTKQDITLKFDDNKNLTYYVMNNYVRALTGEESIYKDEITISNYGNTTTEYNEETFKTKLNEAKLDIDAGSPTVQFTKSVSGDTQYIYHIKYDTTPSEQTWKYFKIQYFFLRTDIFVYRNGKELVKDEDFTLTGAGTVPDAGWYITFNDVITQDDDIYVCVWCDTGKSDANIELTNTI